jgi:anti-sigma regulatory factor (Ser/Thr protein kinase)
LTTKPFESGRFGGTDDAALMSKEGCGEVTWRPHSAEEVSRLVHELVKNLEPHCLQKGFKDADLRLCTILEEAALNAFIHGNNCDNGKAITVRWLCGETVRFEIIDEGQGFDMTSLPDPTSHENITKPNGRGVFIIKQYAHSVGWKDGGKHLVVTIGKDSVFCDRL